jgi:hypothetical protein
MEGCNCGRRLSAPGKITCISTLVEASLSRNFVEVRISMNMQVVSNSLDFASTDIGQKVK